MYGFGAYVPSLVLDMVRIIQTSIHYALPHLYKGFCCLTMSNRASRFRPSRRGVIRSPVLTLRHYYAGRRPSKLRYVQHEAYASASLWLVQGSMLVAGQPPGGSVATWASTLPKRTRERLGPDRETTDRLVCRSTCVSSGRTSMGHCNRATAVDAAC